MKKQEIKELKERLIKLSKRNSYLRMKINPESYAKTLERNIKWYQDNKERIKARLKAKKEKKRQEEMQKIHEIATKMQENPIIEQGFIKNNVEIDKELVSAFPTNNLSINNQVEASADSVNEVNDIKTSDIEMPEPTWRQAFGENQENKHKKTDFDRGYELGCYEEKQKKELLFRDYAIKTIVFIEKLLSVAKQLLNNGGSENGSNEENK